MSCDSACRCDFRTYQIDLCGCGAAPGIEIAVVRPKGDRIGLRGLSHSDAGAAGSFQDPGAGCRSYPPARRFAPACSSTCLEPGAMTSDTFSATVFPLRIDATFIISCSEELVQLPMQTWSTGISPALFDGHNVIRTVEVLRPSGSAPPGRS